MPANGDITTPDTVRFRILERKTNNVHVTRALADGEFMIQPPDVDTAGSSRTPSMVLLEQMGRLERRQSTLKNLFHKLQSQVTRIERNLAQWFKCSGHGDPPYPPSP
ncbi:hypothetical protein K2173_002347 [Erythroxylum novogranatense]|uniref:Uncharacterized protein n=1 Tax=Erythroxylum novogranatense TaxID=1862640 RepID=A0AAV8TAZ1_9ROSI|nr:hypothetical protein K2173_002347 [Erythroxylum novogranatense]